MFYNGFNEKMFYTKMKIINLIVNQGLFYSTQLKTLLSKYYNKDITKENFREYITDFLCLNEIYNSKEVDKFFSHKTKPKQSPLDELLFKNTVYRHLLADVLAQPKAMKHVHTYMRLKNEKNSEKELEKIQNNITQFVNRYIDKTLFVLVDSITNVFSMKSSLMLNGLDTTFVYTVPVDELDSLSDRKKDEILNNTVKEAKEYVLKHIFDVPGITLSMSKKSAYMELCSNVVGNIYMVFGVLTLLLRTTTSEDEKNLAKVYYKVVTDMLLDATQNKMSMKDYYSFDVHFGEPLVNNKYIVYGNRDDSLTIVTAENPFIENDIASGYSGVVTIDKGDYRKFTTLRRLRVADTGILMSGSNTVWSKLFSTCQPKDGNYNNCQSSNTL